MKFLIDNALSPILSIGLNDAGFGSRHVREYGMASAEDYIILQRALSENRIVVTADTDFGTLLALSGANQPSVVIFRGDFPDDPDEQLIALLANLPLLEDSLNQGSVVILDGRRVRIRQLPIKGRLTSDE